MLFSGTMFAMRWLLFVLAVFLCVGDNSAQDYKLEGYFVIESQVLKAYTDRGFTKDDVLYDFAFVFEMVNRRLETLAQYNINIQLLNVEGSPEFLSQSDLDLSDDTVQGKSKTNILEIFDEWLKTTNAMDNKGFDIAVLLTTSNIFSRDHPGSSNEGSICMTWKKDNLPSTVIRFDGTSGTADTLSRVIGKILGANKDGWSSKNVMRSQSKLVGPQNFAFSECSAVDILQFFEAVNVSCLTTTSGSSAAYNRGTEQYAFATDPDEICRKIFNTPDAMSCRSVSIDSETVLMTGDAICGYMYCRKSPQELCLKVMANDELICGKGKVCRGGECVDGPSDLQQESDDCYYKDVPSVKGETCHQALTNGRLSCEYNPYDKCCNECNRRRKRGAPAQPAANVTTDDNIDEAAPDDDFEDPIIID